MLRDIAVKYYDDNCNCAEALLLAANDQYNLGLTDKDIHLVGAFGGGMGCGRTCGALCGMIAALGAMRITTRAHEADGLRAQTAALVKAFEEKLGSTECVKLMATHKTPERRCGITVELAADVFEEFVANL